MEDVDEGETVRLELHDGVVAKFWEITWNDRTVTTRMGKLGSPGKERVKKHRDRERAEMECIRGVKSMIQVGYTRVRDVAEVAEPIQRALQERSLESAKVLADWLEEQGRPGAAWLKEAHDSGAETTQPHEGIEITWQAGFPHRLAMKEACHAAWDHIETLLPLATELVIDVAGKSGTQPPILTSLVGQTSEGVKRIEVASARSATVRFGDLSGAFPGLERLAIKGWYVDLGAFTSTALQELDIECRRLSLEGRFSSVPGLRVLRLAASEEGPEGLHELLGRVHALEELKLRNFSCTNMFQAWFRQSVPTALRVLDVEHCNLTDVDAEALYRCRHELKLESGSLEHNHIDHWLRELRVLPLKLENQTPEVYEGTWE